MIEVTFFRKGNEPVGFEASGHAGYGEYGTDIVCAAVSAVLLTALDGVETLTRAKPAVKRNDDTGFLSAMLPSEMDEAQRHDACLILRTAENGLMSIAQQYPKFVRMNSRNRR